MAKSSRGMSAKDYESVGTSYDGVRILAPKEKATSFTTEEIREAIASVLAERGAQSSKGSRTRPPADKQLGHKAKPSVGT